MGIPSEAELFEKIQTDIEQGDLVLPTLPEVALKVKSAAEDENISAKELAEIIATDAALSARLLQVANSPMYRSSKHIESIQIAITRMGKTLIQNLVSCFVMQQMFQPTSDILDERFRGLWEHSVQVAAICRALARNVSKLDPEQALLAGLIHDIGTLPILVVAEEMDSLVTDPSALDDLIFRLHPKLGKLILEKWDFPEPLSSVVWEHEDIHRSSSGQIDYTDLVIVANLQTHTDQAHPLQHCDWSQVPAFAKLGLTNDVEIIEMEGMAEEISVVEEIFL